MAHYDFAHCAQPVTTVTISCNYIINCSLLTYGFMLQARQQVKAKAQGAADAVKDAVGGKK